MRISRPFERTRLATTSVLSAALLAVSAHGAAAQTAMERLEQVEALIGEGASREAMQEARALYLDLSDRAGFAISRTVLTTAPAPGFAAYEPRPDSVFPQGAPIHVYLELTGASSRQRSDGVSELLFVADFAVFSPEGTQLTDVMRMGEVPMPSRSRGIDVFLELTYNLTGAPPGDYVLWTEITDAISGASEQFELPVTIADGG